MCEFVFGLQKNFGFFSASTQPCCCAARLIWEYLNGKNKKLLKGLKINEHGKTFHTREQFQALALTCLF